MAFSEQIVCVAGAADTVGMGVTVTLTVMASEIHPSSEVAVNVKVVVCGTFVVLVNDPEINAPFPAAGIPVTLTVLLRVQL